MLGEKALRALLLADGAVSARVADRVWPGEVPQADDGSAAGLPALVLRDISCHLATRPVDERPGGGLHQQRITVSVLTDDYPALRELVPLVRAACHGQRGAVVAGVHVDRCSCELIGPALHDDALGVWTQGVDILIRTYVA